jgi:excisionase family DNA binding protein
MSEFLDSPPKLEKLAYTIAEASEAISIGRGALYNAVAARELPAKKRGVTTLILTSDLLAWLAGLPAWKPSHGRVAMAAVARDAKAAERRAQADQRVATTTRRTAAATRKANVAERKRTLVAAE